MVIDPSSPAERAGRPLSPPPAISPSVGRKGLGAAVIGGRVELLPPWAWATSDKLPVEGEMED